MFLCKCLFLDVFLHVRSLRNNRRQPCSGNISDKNVSLCLGSILYVFCFVFSAYVKSMFYFAPLNLPFASKMSSVNCKHLKDNNIKNTHNLLSESPSSL